MRTIVFCEIPNADASRSVAADDLPLIRMDDNIIYRAAVTVGALDRARPRVPDLDRTVLRARHHPFALTVEGYARNVPRMALEGEERVWVR